MPGRWSWKLTSGDMELQLAAVPEEMALKSVSGDLAAELPENEGFAVQYQQVSGERDRLTDNSY